MRNILLEIGEKVVLTIKWQRTRLNCFDVFVFCVWYNLQMIKLSIQLSTFLSKVLKKWLGFSLSFIVKFKRKEIN